MRSLRTATRESLNVAMKMQHSQKKKKKKIHHMKHCKEQPIRTWRNHLIKSPSAFSLKQSRKKSLTKASCHENVFMIYVLVWTGPLSKIYFLLCFVVKNVWKLLIQWSRVWDWASDCWRWKLLQAASCKFTHFWPPASVLWPVKWRQCSLSQDEIVSFNWWLFCW